MLSTGDPLLLWAINLGRVHFSDVVRVDGENSGYSERESRWLGASPSSLELLPLIKRPTTYLLNSV